jgi:hypothetical protein
MTILQWQAVPQHEPPLKEERILMMDCTPVQAQGKGEAPIASREGGHPASPPPTADGVDKLYHQLAQIHAIAAAQLAECACWHRSEQAPSLVQVESGRQGPNATPSAMRIAPLPPTEFSP